MTKAKSHLQVLCADIPERCVGSKGNRQATYFFKNELKKAGWHTEETLLHVMDWKTGGATLHCGQTSFEVFSSPYSLGCSVQGELVAASTLVELETAVLLDKVLLLHGEIAREQIMPKNFVFYNPEEHQRVVAALEQSGVKAIVCATGRNAALAGGVYPFPMFEDGDFDVPSVYMKDTAGEALYACRGRQVLLESHAGRIPETAFNVVGSKGGTDQQRIVISAHIDAKKDTPGAIDNATGVTVLLLLSEMLTDYHGKYPIELAAFNGEDYYAVSGQMKYIEQHEGQFEDVLLNINIDGAGYKEGISSFSSFDLPDEMQKTVLELIGSHPNIVEGLPWYQGDHGIFLQYGRPAIAVSSSWFIENMENQEITHTPKDNLTIVNYDRVVEIALAIRDLILRLK